VSAGRSLDGARPSPLARPAPSGGGQLLPQLDALRGLAILAVFVQHLGDRFAPFLEARITARAPAALAPWLLTVFHHAWWGVDLFFVLSGYSLAQAYVRAFARGAAPAPPALFLRRRALRILPAFYLALVVALATHPAWLARPAFPAALAANLALLQGYLQPGGLVFIGAAWSLTTEAHFYLLFPWLARPLLDPQLPRRRLLILAAVCLFAWITRAVCHRLLLDPGVHTALLEDSQRRWIPCRLDQFALGAFAAALHADLQRSPRAAALRRLAPLALLLSLLALPIAFRLEGALYLSPGGSWPYALVSLSTAALVLSASLCEGWALRLLAPRPLAALGIVSYGVFLYHQLALGLVGHLLGPESHTWTALLANAALALAFSALAGLASWTVIEKPLLARAATKATPL
jgi:peptidoglycan/LPS O-acetylase OafA/YrhL